MLSDLHPWRQHSRCAGKDVSPTDRPRTFATSFVKAACPQAVRVLSLPRGHFPPGHLPPALPKHRAKAGPRGGDSRCSPSGGGGKKGKESGERDQMFPWEPARAVSGSIGRVVGVRNDETFTAKVLSGLVPCSLPRPPHVSIAQERRGWECVCPDPNSCTTRNSSSNIIY